MSKFKLPIIIVVVLAALGGGLFASGMVGGKDDSHAKKHVIEPVPMAEPFTVNLADPDQTAILAFNVAIQLEPMDAEHYATWSGANAGGHGGGGEAPGPGKVATYPKFRDAVIATAQTFTSDRLKTEQGREDFRNELLKRFAVIAEVDESEAKSSVHDPAHVAPPYHVMDVLLTDFVYQIS